jgi:serine/threonine protein kinase
MALTIGTQLGSHEITALLGKGGMGEVYRARDLKLKREVAIKILPEEFSRDADRLSRFQREAEVLASLNHPNIANIYDLEEQNGSRYLVLELVEGETLADRIAPGPIPVEEALHIAKSICEALEAAHEKGVIHRDLKPANVKLTPDGKVKVLDFGLAKAIETGPATTALSNSPTMLSAVTNAGVILGTAAYMSPEQAKGKPVDRRADIWAFGVVLYEMLTGRMAFSGETVSETMAAVMLKEPAWAALPASVPARVRDLLRSCLVKEPRNRIRDIGDVRIAIDGMQSGTEIDAQVLQTSVRRSSRVFIVIATVLFFMMIASLVTVSVLYFNRSEPPEIRLEVNTPSASDPLSFAISPDGRRLVFSASSEGKSQLWVRPLGSLTAQPLVGTDGAAYPFWSPDSASVGFFADAKLKRIDIVGGALQSLANAISGRGAAWNRDGIILFCPSATGPLFKVPATGGEAVPVTRLETGQQSHRFPQFLPDGRHFIYFSPFGPSQGVYAASLDGGPPKRLTDADAPAAISTLGFLIFLRQATLFAQAFDFKRQGLSGDPTSVAEQVAFDPITAAPGFSVASGIVAYRTGSANAAQQLTWFDRSGKVLRTIGSRDATLRDVELSPDGKRIAVTRAVSGNQDLWLIDDTRGVPTRFTSDTAIDIRPVWSPEGSRIAFMSSRKGAFNLYWRLSSNVGPDELLMESGRGQVPVPTDWSSDGRFLLFQDRDAQTNFDLWVLPMSGDKKEPIAFLKSAFEERNGQFSPDSKWIAYQSNSTGRAEISIKPFPGPGEEFTISKDGGAQPRWNKNGKEIFYISLDGKMMPTSVKLSPDGRSAEVGTPVALFPVRIAGSPVSNIDKQQYAVSSDGQRFLVNLAADEGAASPINLIYNWKPQSAK